MLHIYIILLKKLIKLLGYNRVINIKSLKLMVINKDLLWLFVLMLDFQLHG